MISVGHKGDFSKTTKFLQNISKPISNNILDKYGRDGVAALMAATPTRSGLTANSWYYKIEKTNSTTSLVFLNSNIQNGVPIAIILQYGHGTRNGGYVQGLDYINPALKPIFDRLADAAWKEVTNA